MRFMFIIRSDNREPPTPELLAAAHELARGEVAAGRMIADGGLMPPHSGAGVRLAGGKLVVMDGPFAESKEAIGGFAIFELPDLAAAKASAEQFLDLHRRHMPNWQGSCEIRPVAGSMVEEVRRLAPAL